MSKFIDISGEKYGKLTVIKFNKMFNGFAYFDCICDCGEHRTVRSNGLKSGNTKSCGCYSREQASKANFIHGDANKTDEYVIWVAMNGRCYNENNTAYKSYGARGITVCDRWKDSYENFISDMGRRPTPKHSIDRIENDKGYSPDNCRWATQKEQCRNQRSNRAVVHIDSDQVFATITMAAEFIGINYRTLKNQLLRGNKHCKFKYYEQQVHSV
jgi:hypothetical protein